MSEFERESVSMRVSKYESVWKSDRVWEWLSVCVREREREEEYVAEWDKERERQGKDKRL